MVLLHGWPQTSHAWRKVIPALDIVPHEQVLAGLTAEVARGAWHYFFNAVPDLPELLVQDRVEPFLRAFFWPRCHNPAVFVEEGIAEPVLCLWGNQGGMGAVFDVLAMWRREAEAVHGHAIPDCGHYPAEES